MKGAHTPESKATIALTSTKSSTTCHSFLAMVAKNIGPGLVRTELENRFLKAITA
jgi:hypothetical protein